jgi:ribosomal protein S18 acetylase RimI-like enzyme
VRPPSGAWYLDRSGRAKPHPPLDVSERDVARNPDRRHRYPSTRITTIATDIPSTDLPVRIDPAGTRFLPASGFSLDAIAALFNRGFEDYFVPIRMTADGLAQMVRSDSIDLAASKVLTLPEGPAGFILIGTRGWTRRVSAMGVIAVGRGRGLGRLLMEHVIEEASAAGFRRVVLEVIEQNTKALTLYRHLGFGETQRLVGYERAAAAEDPATDDVLREIDPRELAKIVEYEAPPDLPWQLSAETVAAAGPPSMALRLEDRAYALVNGRTDDAATLLTILVPHAVRRQGWGLRMIRALTARFPGRSWRVPARFPENLAPGFFDRAGFERMTLTQFEMCRELT